jgi:hypothetical protein
VTRRRESYIRVVSSLGAGQNNNLNSASRSFQNMAQLNAVFENDKYEYIYEEIKSTLSSSSFYYRETQGHNQL